MNLSAMKHFLLFLLCAGTLQAADQSCLNDALALLQKRDANGYRIYQLSKDPDAFSFWLSCSDGKPLHSKLPAAVHETLHKVDGELEQNGARGRAHFYLLGGRVISVARHTQLFERAQVAALLTDEEKRTHYFRPYLTGVSGKQKLDSLLEEFNAYTHDLSTSVTLVDLKAATLRSSNRDGVLTFMYYLELYLKQARTNFAGAWQVLVSDRDYVEAIRALWANAEVALARACPHAQLGVSDSFLARKVYSASNLEAINELFKQAQAKSLLFQPISKCGGWSGQNEGGNIVGKSRSAKITIQSNGQQYTLDQARELAKTDPEMKQLVDEIDELLTN